MENGANTLETCTENEKSESVRDQTSYWKRVVKNYEKRNASLERRRDALIERVHFMECALPSLLMGAAVANTKQRIPEQLSKVSCKDPVRSSHKT